MMNIAIREALIGRGVDEGATPDERMREVIAWYMGDPEWWGLIKEWMADSGYTERALAETVE